MTEARMQELAEQQHGVVALRQVDGAARAARRSRSAHWDAVTPTVLRRRGSPQTVEQQVLIGVLDAGDGAVASHGTAAALWRLPGFAVEPVEVTRGGRRMSKSRPVAVLHRPVLLGTHHRTETSGVPVTTLARTLFDLAGRLREERLARLVNLVANRSPGTLVSLHRLLGELAGRGRPGIQVMRAVLAERPVGSVLPATGLEMRFEQVLAEGGQASLRRQVDLGGHEWIGRVDFYDATLGLVVEVDSLIHHGGPMERASDARRDGALLAVGVRKVLRVPEEHLWYHPHLVREAVRDARSELRRPNLVHHEPASGF
jgi:very-short-patch-repair endonuclease